MPVIPGLKIRRKEGQKFKSILNDRKFEVRLHYIKKPYLKKTKRVKEIVSKGGKERIDFPALF